MVAGPSCHAVPWRASERKGRCVSSILVTNDDGPGELLELTVKIAQRLFECVTVVVPAGNRTGCSAGITLNAPIEIRSTGDAAGISRWTVSGLPNDGVRYGLRELCPRAIVVL